MYLNINMQTNMDSFNCPTKTNISRYYRPIVGLSKNAASTLASPEEMDIKEAFFHTNNIILLYNNKRIHSLAASLMSEFCSLPSPCI